MSTSPTTKSNKATAKGGGQPSINVIIPKAFAGLFKKARYKVYYGGRGSAKSWTVAEVLVILAYCSTLRILCAREFQNSITDSVHRLLSDTIERLGLVAFFKITQTGITCLTTGSEFLFKGIRHNVNEIKSLEGVDIAWIEEAQRVSKESWEVLIPTIRKEGSEIWITFNPASEDDPTYQRFVINAEPDWVVRKVNFTENPYFPATLRAEMEFTKKTDYEAYLHIWEGHPKRMSDAVVFKNKFRVEAFETPANVERFFFGADWGFSQDPTTLVRCFIKDHKLYIDYEAYGVGVEIDEIPALFISVPGIPQWQIKADNSRPETISAMNRAGLNVKAAAKWPGSVEDGIEYLRSFEEIVIHERCKRTAEEFRLYSYKVDKQTEEVLPVLVDKHNHCIDALRYALDGYIRKPTATKTVPFNLMAR